MPELLLQMVAHRRMRLRHPSAHAHTRCRRSERPRVAHAQANEGSNKALTLVNVPCAGGVPLRRQLGARACGSYPLTRVPLSVKLREEEEDGEPSFRRIEFALQRQRGAYCCQTRWQPLWCRTRQDSYRHNSRPATVVMCKDVMALAADDGTSLYLSLLPRDILVSVDRLADLNAWRWTGTLTKMDLPQMRLNTQETHCPPINLQTLLSNGEELLIRLFTEVLPPCLCRCLSTCISRLWVCKLACACRGCMYVACLCASLLQGYLEIHRVSRPGSTPRRIKCHRLGTLLGPLRDLHRRKTRPHDMDIQLRDTAVIRDACDERLRGYDACVPRAWIYVPVLWWWRRRVYLDRRRATIAPLLAGFWLWSEYAHPYGRTPNRVAICIL